MRRRHQPSRHVEIEPRTDGRIELRSVDTGKQVTAAGWRDLDGGGELPLLSLAARQFGFANATLVTRGESPAGAGMAGSFRPDHRDLRRADALVGRRPPRPMSACCKRP